MSVAVGDGSVRAHLCHGRCRGPQPGGLAFCTPSSPSHASLCAPGPPEGSLILTTSLCSSPAVWLSLSAPVGPALWRPPHLPCPGHHRCLLLPDTLLPPPLWGGCPCPPAASLTPPSLWSLLPPMVGPRLSCPSFPCPVASGPRGGDHADLGLHACPSWWAGLPRCTLIPPSVSSGLPGTRLASGPEAAEVVQAAEASPALGVSTLVAGTGVN